MLLCFFCFCFDVVLVAGFDFDVVLVAGFDFEFILVAGFEWLRRELLVC